MDEKKGAVNIRGTWTEFPLYGSKDAKSFSNLEFSVDMSSKIRDILGAHRPLMHIIYTKSQLL